MSLRAQRPLKESKVQAELSVCDWCDLVGPPVREVTPVPGTEEGKKQRDHIQWAPQQGRGPLGGQGYPFLVPVTPCLSPPHDVQVVSKTFMFLIAFSLLETLGGRYQHHTQLTDEETEALRGYQPVETGREPYQRLVIPPSL